MRNFSVILPFKTDNGRRAQIFEYIRHRYELLMPDIELCICYDDSEPFCKAKAINEAARKATGEVFIITDADVFFEPELLQRIDLHLHVHHWLQPFRYCHLLSEQASNRLLSAGIIDKFTIRSNESELAEIAEAGPLMNVMTRECFEAVGGYDERFKGWGWEDVAFAYSLDAICGLHYTMNDTIYHLWHPLSANKESEDFNRNFKLYYRYYTAAKTCPADVRKIIQER